MRKRVCFIFALAALLAGAFAVSNQTTPVGSAPAIVINDIGCGMLDGNGGGVFTTNSHAVINANGNGMISCKADVAPAAGGGAVRWDNANTGLLCGTLSDVTAQWGETVSASGKASLSCHNDG